MVTIGELRMAIDHLILSLQQIHDLGMVTILILKLRKMRLTEALPDHTAGQMAELRCRSI